jgi:nitrogen fixation protein NifB
MPFSQIVYVSADMDNISYIYKGKMSSKNRLEEMIRTHPCYNEAAHLEFARMHLPVAPECNIQCNYCNRKYDCSNESRPGVTSEVLTPEQSVIKIHTVMEKIPNLRVIGIAGPGDPLANENTFRTLELVSKEFPDLTLCLSTNGLMLPDNAKRLYDLGVRFITVTMNATDPEIGGRIYEKISWQGRTHTGADGAAILIAKQEEGIRMCADLGMVVKVNIVMVPGINDTHIPELVKTVKALGAYIVNILPLIPVEGTKFENFLAPTPKERKDLMDLCSVDAKMMRHCRQCRADAIGMLDNDRSGEFSHLGSCTGGCGPTAISDPIVPRDSDEKGTVLAVASSDGVTVDSGFGNASRFIIYRVNGKDVKLLRMTDVDISEPVAGRTHREHLETVMDALSDCDIIIVKEIGDLPAEIVTARKKRVVISSDGVRAAVTSAMESR